MRQLRSREIERPLGEEAELQDSVVREIAGMLQLELGANERQALSAGETGTSSAYDFYLQARGHLQRRGRDDIDQAIQMFQQAKTLDPKYALAYAGLGEAYWRKYRETRDTQWVAPARENCQLALKLNNQLAPVYVTLGIIEEGAGRHAEALDALEKARQLEPANPSVFSELGAVEEAMGKLDDAESRYKAAAQLRPSDWTSLNRWAASTTGAAATRTPFRFSNRSRNSRPATARAIRTWARLTPWPANTRAPRSASTSRSALRPTASAYSNLGTIYFFLGRCAEAFP